MTTTVAEAFIQITQEADSKWIQRKRKVDTKMLIMNVAQGKVNRIGLRQLCANRTKRLGCQILLSLHLLTLEVW
jgi:hypothetical protein